MRNNRINRLCIVTWRCSYNYGTSLQAFALEWKMRSLGYSVSILSELRCPHTAKEILVLLLRTFRLLRLTLWIKSRFIKRNCTSICSGDTNSSSLNQRRIDKIREWGKLHHNAKDVLSWWGYCHLLMTTDCFISGSDQIWNTYVDWNPVMYLTFAKGRKRIAYGPSIGTSDVNPLRASKMRQWLEKYAHIGVRELTAKKALGDLLGRQDIEQVVDPTLLITKDEWLAIVQADELKVETPYLLCYLLGRNEAYDNAVCHIAEILKLSRIVIVPSLERPDFSIPGAVIVDDANPFEFVSLLAKAAWVCTDSFHGTAFSINLQKQFVLFRRFSDQDKASQNSRLYDMLKRYGLLKQIYESSNMNWNRPIDYDAVDRLVMKDRAKSLNFLKTSVET